MLATGLRKAQERGGEGRGGGTPRKRHTTGRLYSRISRAVYREISTAYPAGVLVPRRVYIRQGMCLALLKPFPDNTSAPLRSRARALACRLPLTFCIMHACIHVHPVHIMRASSISFSRSVYDLMRLSRGFTMIGKYLGWMGEHARTCTHAHARV